MGSSSGPNTKCIDASVGGLVWVRRRNGSWWPGRIMGVNELSESCLVSPRSGTPVKLLGREDASVDWYNLEKSKRVKAFRCGEYDECIEKAKAAAASSSKKAVKYARREDAILHALELESVRQSNCHLNLCSRMDKSDGEQNGLKESPGMSHHSEETELIAEDSSSFEENSNSAQELSQSGVSFEDPNQISASIEQSVQGRRRRTPNDSEDDGTEGIKRMRGLEDLGMGGSSSLKRKRSQVGNVQELLKRKNRRRPLTKVLESTAMVSVPVMCEQLASPSGSDDKVSVLESNESKKSVSTVINNKSDSTGVTCENGTSQNASEQAFDASIIKQKENEISSMLGLPENYSSDRLFDVPLVRDEKHSGGFSPTFVSSSSQKHQVGAGAQSSQSSQVDTVSPGNEELNESGSTSSGAADMSNMSQKIDKGTSKWQSKGKRNSRHKTKSRKDSRKLLDVLETDVDEFRGWRWHNSHKEPHMWVPTPTPQRSLPYRQSRFTVNPKYEMADFPVRSYNAGPILYDVILEVKASSRPQHVPYISLMSKLNSQPIVGHPVTIEVLDDGFCDHLVSGPKFYRGTSSCELDDDDLEENISALDCTEMGKHLTLQARVSPCKSPKSRKNGLLSKKIRTLSSLTGSRKHSDEEKKPVVEKLKGPSIACVPLKVVFSRINASLNSSIRVVHRASTS